VKALDVLGLNVEATSGSLLILLREKDAPNRVLPIFIGVPEAIAIAVAMSGESPPRPLTHDLLAALIDNLDVHVDHVEVTGVRDGAFIAELAVRGPSGGVSLDSRPSDAIALALRVDAPVFASEAALDQAGAIVAVRADEDPIDDDMARLRTFLDEVDPAEFEMGQGPDDRPDGPDT
jgi:uncharacterized protein